MFLCAATLPRFCLALCVAGAGLEGCNHVSPSTESMLWGCDGTRGDLFQGEQMHDLSVRVIAGKRVVKSMCSDLGEHFCGCWVALLPTQLGS